MDAISPELVLVDPALAQAERPVAVPVRAYQFQPRGIPASSRQERVLPRFARGRNPPVWGVALLVSLLANGFLTAFVLFGEHPPRPSIETSVGSSKLGPGAVAPSPSVAWVPGPDFPPIQPSSGRSR